MPCKEFLSAFETLSRHSGSEKRRRRRALAVFKNAQKVNMRLNRSSVLFLRKVSVPSAPPQKKGSVPSALQSCFPIQMSSLSCALQKGIDDEDSTVVLSVIEIFGEEFTGPAYLSCCDDHRVPE